MQSAVSIRLNWFESFATFFLFYLFVPFMPRISNSRPKQCEQLRYESFFSGNFWRKKNNRPNLSINTLHHKWSECDITVVRCILRSLEMYTDDENSTTQTPSEQWFYVYNNIDTMRNIYTAIHRNNNSAIDVLPNSYPI